VIVEAATETNGIPPTGRVGRGPCLFAVDLERLEGVYSQQDITDVCLRDGSRW